MSERDLTPAVKTETESDLTRLALFAELVFDSGAVRLWTGIGPIPFDGHIYTGAGNLVGVSSVQETAGDVRATGIAMTLSGINKSLVQAIMAEHFQSRPVTIWLGMFDDDWALIPDPITLFKGRMDYPILEAGGDTVKITVRAESVLIDLERARVRRYTDADQRELYPDDTGLRFIASLQNKEVPWGG